jgi:hypothetical protein
LKTLPGFVRDLVILITQERDEEHSGICSGLSKYATKLTDEPVLESAQIKVPRTKAPLRIAG